MRARTSLALIAVLVTSAVCGTALGADSIPSCKAPPVAEKLPQPTYPPDVESRGLPNPVTVLVEFTLGQDGSVSDVKAIETDAGGYAAAFEAEALRAVMATRFKAS